MSVGLSAAVTLPRQSCELPKKSVSEVVLNFANASRRVIMKDEGEGMKDNVH
jgi:hypothetical protein